MTNNYGLKGGMLDGSKHIARAIERLCTPSEIGVYCERTQGALPKITTPEDDRNGEL